MNDSIIVIFGATGDLAKRKLLPSLYRLFFKKKLNNVVIVGTAFDDVSAFEMLREAKKNIKDVDNEMWNDFSAYVYYQKLDFEKSNDFIDLEKNVALLEKKHDLSGRRLVYFSAPPNYFCTLTKLCAKSKLVQKKEFHSIVYEKPFGNDFVSAREINTCIKNYFNESQIYRIDHYLTKEIVSNIAMVRFSNIIFEPLWNNRFIDNIQIVLNENACIEGRGNYYDNYGAMRDVVQNHMLELLALIAMETPEKLTGEFIRENRAEVLRYVRVADGLLGQYQGYAQEKGVKKKSKTETLAALQLYVENERWSGVPFYLRTGKCLDAKKTAISITFKNVECLMAKGCPMDPNILTIGIDPQSLFSLHLNAKKAGVSDELTTMNMEYCHSCDLSALTPGSYETIFEELFRQEKSISVRFDEIESSWNIVDAAYAKNFPLYIYKKGTNGPDECQNFAKKHKIRWVL
ncbi:glucose-6-phosphate dehydrogenase [bacterium]|nr:glucose-6-phosphate dehydrogenase [bacterium]